MKFEKKFSATDFPAFTLSATGFLAFTLRFAFAFTFILTFLRLGLVSVVSDSYDVFNCVENIWGKELKSMIEARKENDGCLVIRPDSGDPKEIVVKVGKTVLGPLPLPQDLRVRRRKKLRKFGQKRSF